MTSRERDYMGPSNPTKNPNRTYSADASIHALVQGPAEDASSKQDTHDKTNLNGKE